MKQAPFLERRSPLLGATYALLILMAFFFLVPSSFRAARLSLERKENDIKDWLPSDFRETAELEWFGKHFAGESFVLATWPGCTSGDQRLKLFEQKLLHECDTFDPSIGAAPELLRSYRLAKEIGNEIGLLRSADDFYDWGGKKEKWLSTTDGQWYFITPDGELFRWEEGDSAPAASFRAIRRALGRYQLAGTFVTAFGDPATDQTTNPFYNDPSLLCASLFHSVQTGDTLVDELASEGGPLWPIDLTDPSRRGIVARRRAMQRLTGTLYSPAVPADFAWTPEAFREAIEPHRREPLPDSFEPLVKAQLAEIIETQFDGSVQDLANADLDTQTNVWYEVFDAAAVEPPPRLTCVLVTLTDLAKDNLPYALGRGVLGGQRGRLLQLAQESGVLPAAPPSIAPPPFDRELPETRDGMPPLRLGGPPVDNLAVDEEGTITLVRLVGYSVVIGFVLSFICFRSFPVTCMIFGVGGAAAMLSMSMVWWTGGTVDAILMTMPSLVYVLGLSGSIHVVNYYRDEVRLRGERGSAGRALRHALIPCSLASITTAIGLISLFTSNLAPISNFGLYSAIGIIATLAILFSYLPAALQTFTPKLVEHQPTVTPEQPLPESLLSDAWAAAGRWITGHHKVVSIACLAVLAIASLGFFKIKTSVHLLKLFDPGSRIIRDYAWLEENFGKLVPMELIVRVPAELQAEHAGDAAEDPSIDALELIERVDLAGRLRTVVDKTCGQTGKAMASDTFLPPVPQPQNGYSVARSKMNRELLESFEDLRTSDYLRIEQTEPFVGSELWRVSLRVPALQEIDHGQFIAKMRTSIEPVLRAYDARQSLLTALTDGDTGKLVAKPKVLVLGSNSPPALVDATLRHPNGEVDPRATFVSTFGELLSGERIETPKWREISREQAESLVSSERWDRYLSRFDAVVWLGSNGFEKADLKSAQNVLDFEPLIQRVTEPSLIGERIPYSQGADSLQAVYTGLVPVVYKAQRTLLYSLGNSIGLAFVLIAAVMILLLNPGRGPLGWIRPANFANGLAAGLVAMIPNVFPVLLVFGAMCHWGTAIDIGIMMTASVAMGVAVDDTIHFLSWFRKHIDSGASHVDAVIETYRRVGPAMTQTTIVGGLGLFVFALSTFTPTQQFGRLMLIMLAAALVGDLVLLPALLVGPAGRWFKPRHASPVVQNAAENASAGEDPHEDDALPNELAADSAMEPSVPTLRVHYPGHRSDRPHRVK